MTIDEAIKHCEEVADNNDYLKERYDAASGYTRSHNEAIRTKDAKKREKCAVDHRQLAEWLRELKELREPKKVCYEGDGYADGRMVYDMAHCPNCYHSFEEGDENWQDACYCPNCGQALKWEE